MESLITGFASPAQGYEEPPIDINALVQPNPRSSYTVNVTTDRYRALGLTKGDVAIVDRSYQAAPGFPLLFSHENAFTCGYLSDIKKNDVYFGRITFVIRKLPAEPLPPADSSAVVTTDSELI